MAGARARPGAALIALRSRRNTIGLLGGSFNPAHGGHRRISLFAAEALGGLTPQGYLAVDRRELIVPCGTALPARVDLNTGELKYTLKGHTGKARQPAQQCREPLRR